MKNPISSIKDLLILFLVGATAYGGYMVYEKIMGVKKAIQKILNEPLSDTPSVVEVSDDIARTEKVGEEEKATGEKEEIEEEVEVKVPVQETVVMQNPDKLVESTPKEITITVTRTKEEIVQADETNRLLKKVAGGQGYTLAQFLGNNWFYILIVLAILYWYRPLPNEVDQPMESTLDRFKDRPNDLNGTFGEDLNNLGNPIPNLSQSAVNPSIGLEMGVLGKKQVPIINVVPIKIYYQVPRKMKPYKMIYEELLAQWLVEEEKRKKHQRQSHQDKTITMDNMLDKLETSDDTPLFFNFGDTTNANIFIQIIVGSETIVMEAPTLATTFKDRSRQMNNVPINNMQGALPLPVTVPVYNQQDHQQNLLDRLDEALQSEEVLRSDLPAIFQENSQMIGRPQELEDEYDDDEQERTNKEEHEEKAGELDEFEQPQHYFFDLRKMEQQYNEKERIEREIEEKRQQRANKERNLYENNPIMPIIDNDDQIEEAINNGAQKRQQRNNKERELHENNPIIPIEDNEEVIEQAIIDGEEKRKERAKREREIYENNPIMPFEEEEEEEINNDHDAGEGLQRVADDSQDGELRPAQNGRYRVDGMDVPAINENAKYTKKVTKRTFNANKSVSFKKVIKDGLVAGITQAILNTSGLSNAYNLTKATYQVAIKQKVKNMVPETKEVTKTVTKTVKGVRKTTIERVEQFDLVDEYREEAVYKENVKSFAAKAFYPFSTWFGGKDHGPTNALGGGPNISKQANDSIVKDYGHKSTRQVYVGQKKVSKGFKNVTQTTTDSLYLLAQKLGGMGFFHRDIPETQEYYDDFVSDWHYDGELSPYEEEYGLDEFIWQDEGSELINASHNDIASTMNLNEAYNNPKSDNYQKLLKAYEQLREGTIDDSGDLNYDVDTKETVPTGNMIQDEDQPFVLDENGETVEEVVGHETKESKYFYKDENGNWLSKEEVKNGEHGIAKKDSNGVVQIAEFTKVTTKTVLKQSGKALAAAVGSKLVVELLDTLSKPFRENKRMSQYLEEWGEDINLKWESLKKADKCQMIVEGVYIVTVAGGTSLMCCLAGSEAGQAVGKMAYNVATNTPVIKHIYNIATSDAVGMSYKYYKYAKLAYGACTFVGALGGSYLVNKLASKIPNWRQKASTDDLVVVAKQTKEGVSMVFLWMKSIKEQCAVGYVSNINKRLAELLGRQPNENEKDDEDLLKRLKERQEVFDDLRAGVPQYDPDLDDNLSVCSDGELADNLYDYESDASTQSMYDSYSLHEDMQNHRFNGSFFNRLPDDIDEAVENE